MSDVTRFNVQRRAASVTMEDPQPRLQRRASTHDASAQLRQNAAFMAQMRVQRTHNRQSGGRNSHLLVEGSNNSGNGLSFDATDGNGFNMHPGGLTGLRGGMSVTNGAMNGMPGAGGDMTPEQQQALMRALQKQMGGGPPGHGPGDGHGH